MSFATSIRNRVGDRFVALLATVGLIMSTMVIFASPAMAHHPVIDSYSRCLNDGTLGLVVRSKAWTFNPDQYGNHDDVRLEVQLPGSSTWYEVGSGAYTPENGRRFEVRLPATFEITSGVTVGDLEGQTIGVRAWIMDTNGGQPGVGWYNDAGDYNTADAGNGNADSTMTLTLLDCETPTPPSGWACVNGDVTFIEDATDFEGTLYDTQEEAAQDEGCVPPPTPPGWACVDGSVIEVDRGTFEGNETIYDSPGEAAQDEGCRPPSNPTPPGWACVDGSVIQVDRATFEGPETIYDSEADASQAPGCVEVSAATTFTIGGDCSESDGAVTFTVSGELGEGLSLVVAGETVDTAGPYSVDVGSAGEHPYLVTVGDGYELAEGSPAAEGSVSVPDCTPPDEVAALILVDVWGTCEVVGDDGVGNIHVTMSVPGGATVEVRDSDGNLEGILEDDGTITVADDATYSWVATVSEGNEFPSDFDSTGSVAIEDCTPVEELPFTGLDAGWMAMLATALLGAGALVVRYGRFADEQ